MKERKTYFPCYSNARNNSTAKIQILIDSRQQFIDSGANDSILHLNAISVYVYAKLFTFSELNHQQVPYFSPFSPLSSKRKPKVNKNKKKKW